LGSELCPLGGEQQGLRPGRHVVAVEQDLADLFSDLGTARLTNDTHAPPLGGEGVGQLPTHRRLAGAVDSLDGEIEAHSSSLGRAPRTQVIESAASEMRCSFSSSRWRSPHRWAPMRTASPEPATTTPPSSITARTPLRSSPGKTPAMAAAPTPARANDTSSAVRENV